MLNASHLIALVIGLLIGFFVGGRTKLARVATEELITILADRQKAATMAREAAAKVSEVIAKVSEVISPGPKAPDAPTS
jgi:hypothetical protein